MCIIQTRYQSKSKLHSWTMNFISNIRECTVVLAMYKTSIEQKLQNAQSFYNDAMVILMLIEDHLPLQT
uniref:Uncharacterized protein n=1 Tax=Arundo donax TaxID=35708 RepID=A0A0A9ANQ8_ARUDO